MPGDYAYAKTVEQQSPFSLEDLRKILAGVVNETPTQAFGEPPDEWAAKTQILSRELLNKLLQQKNRFKNVFITASGSRYFVLTSGENFRIKSQNKDAINRQYELQPILKHLFFIDPKEWERLMTIVEQGRVYAEVSELSRDEGFQARKKIYELLSGKKMSDEAYQKKEASRKGIQKLVGEPIATTSLKPGVMPFELDFVDGNEETIFKVDNGRLVLAGTTITKENGEQEVRARLFGALHHGNLVREVVKG